MKKILLALLNIFVLFSIEAKELELKKIYIDGREEIVLLDENIETIILYTSDAHPGELKDIAGLNQFKKLKYLEFPMLHYNGDWSFLYGLTTLKTLYVDSYSKGLKSLKFLESLSNLETFGCNLLVNESYKDYFFKEIIDLANLEHIKTIYYQCRVWNKDFTGWYYLGRIPNFVNVKNKPVLDLNDNGIEYLTSREKKLLKQYSEVKLYSNPIFQKKESKI